MKYRKLRIAWSVWWGAMAVLLVVLWVRSYWVSVFIGGPIAYTDFIVESMGGILHLAISPSGEYATFEFASGPASIPPFVPGHHFDCGHNPNQGWYLQMPHWCLAVLSLALASMPWLRWRFSLRTLLIATTLVALLVGMIVWAIRG